jgi:outer membrane protein assembly factor BamB/tetratricopeptide (TPR) repeat protein
MHITVFCPHCQTRYQLDETLRGKRMRCPNSLCRQVFEVREVDQPSASPSQQTPLPTPSAARAGEVGELVPVLQAEAASTSAEAPQEKPRKAVSGKELTAQEASAAPLAPSVVTPALDDLEIPGDEPAAAPFSPEGSGADPIEFAAGAWEAPPVRNGRASGPRPAAIPLAVPRRPVEPVVPQAAKPAAEPAGPETKPATKARRHLLLMVTMLVVLGGALGGGLLLLSGTRAGAEADRFKKAQEHYQNRDFDEAVAAFQKLLRDYPASSNRRQLDFLVELSAVRAAVYAPRDDTDERASAAGRLNQFLEIYRNDPMLKEYHGDIWDTLVRLTRELSNLAEQKQDPAHLDQARRSWALAAKFNPPAGAKVDEVASSVTAELGRVNSLLAARTARLELLESLRALAARGSADAVRTGRARAKTAGLEQDAEVATLLEALVKAHRARVVFTPAPGPGKDTEEDDDGPEPPPTPTAPGKGRVPAAEDTLPSFYVAPLSGKIVPGARPARAPDVVLALARGVLYALSGERGEVRWLRRVGVDTAVLPLRLPASPFGPELVLVVSTDGKSVAGVAADAGAVVWRHTLADVCLGQPVLVDGHLLVPTVSGQVEEIEATGGAWQGSYSLGQPLVAGGVHQPGTTLVYFPADDYCVYVLDVAKRVCAGILYSGHASGSLRGLPLVWNDEAQGALDKGQKTPEPTAAGGGWLLLSLASGAGNVQLLPYALPITQPDQKPASINITVRGDTSSAPWQDGEKLAVATDAGILALYGIRQKRNRDPLLFPLLQDDYRFDSGGSALGAGRSLVVYADAENYWVVSGGKLQRLEHVWNARTGPGLAPRWPQPVEVGSPLHAGQVRVGADGQVSLILVTQELDSPTCWARAIAAADGQVLWQRQLGMVAQDRAILAGAAVLVPDARGLVIFDAPGGREPPEPRKDGASRPQWSPASGIIDNVVKSTGQHTWARGAGFVHASWNPTTMHIRVVDDKRQTRDMSFPLPAPPAGSPALGSAFVLVPLVNGVLVRLPLEGGDTLTGPEWRGPGVDESQRCHIVALGNDEFVVTDGGRSLMRLHWGDAKLAEKRAEAELPHRITLPPAHLGQRLFVADASDILTTLDGSAGQGRMQPGRRWSFGGAITAGPFVRGAGVGVVVGKNRLVWLDPDKEQPAWEYTFLAPVVGLPELVEGVLIVADLQGGIMGFDPATGKSIGPGYRLKANEAPAATPVAFGAGQVFVPLMDGTAMLVPLTELR